MEIDNYRNFLAIVEAGSMTAASEYIHIAQPALSKQVKSLENYFGTKLIITTRGSKHLILTDAGRILYHKAKYICSLEDMAKNEIGDVSDGSKGTLRFTVAIPEQLSSSRNVSSLFIASSLSSIMRSMKAASRSSRSSFSPALQSSGSFRFPRSTRITLTSCSAAKKRSSA